MNRINVVRNLCVLQRNLTIRCQSNSAIDIKKLEQETVLEIDVADDEVKLKEAEIEKKRNKSRLQEAHYNIIHDEAPYKEPAYWTHGTIKYQRKLFGRYGKASGVDPALCWPTQKELSERLEYEKVAYPFTISEVVETAKRKKQEKEEALWERQKDISEKILKLDDWTRDLKAKIAKKEAEATAAKERKQQLVEEVRRHFGYTIDPKDEKFKEMLERKEKEQKKAMKDARKKVKEEQLLQKLLSKNEKSNVSENTESESK